MTVNGREVGLAYNMRAAKMIVDIAPERDLSRTRGVAERLLGKCHRKSGAFYHRNVYGILHEC